MRLIDVDAQIVYFEGLAKAQANARCFSAADTAQHAAEKLKRAPTVDAVEVVRCKDCKHRGIVTECPMCYTEDSYDDDYGYDYWDVDKTVDDGFCHCGEMDAEVTDDQT